MDNRIGSNIRALRKAYGETQEELGEHLGFLKTAISNFECGLRNVDDETLKKIAKHYQVPVDVLLLSDLSDMMKINVEPSLFIKRIDLILPIIQTEENLKNEHFEKAYKCHMKLFEKLRENKDGDEIINLFSICHEEYLAVYRDEKLNLEAGANYISLWYLWIFLLKGSIQFRESKTAALQQYYRNNPKIENISEKIDEKKVEEINDYIRTNNNDEKMEEIDNIKKALKKSEKYSDLADYFIALEYLWNIVDENNPFELNQFVGHNMLIAFFRVDNKYAISYLSYEFDALGYSPQVVDDN